ncbi:MAG: transglycosylase SLT domain-containing protein [Burkholderiaceae bacterium]
MRRVCALLLSISLGCAMAQDDERNDEGLTGNGARAGVTGARIAEADRAFQDALRALQRDDDETLARLAALVPSDYPLRDYVDYWLLRQRLRALDKHEIAPDPAVSARAEHFIKTHADQLTGDLVRRQWMLTLGKHGQWSAFDRHLQAWQRRNDTRVFCYAGLANVARGRAVGEQAMNALQNDRDLGEACGALMRALHANGTLDKAAVRRRMWDALEVRDWSSVRLLAELLAVPETLIERAIRQSESLILELDAGPGPLTDAERDALLVALTRRLGPEPTAVAERLDELGRLLNPQERAFVWAQTAASAMRDMLPTASEYARRAAGAPIGDITRRWLIRAALREQDWALVLNQIGQLSSEQQASPDWTYWRGRALDALGSHHGARALYRKIAQRHDFYGELAAEAIGRPISAPKRTVRPPSATEIARVQKLPGIARALKFYELDMRYRGNREWNFAVRDLGERELLAAATWACQRGLLERCISTAERTSGLHDFALRFVRPFEESLAPLARERGLDLAWIYGLIRQESRFLADARSSAGARGLMQIMPSTGRWIARRLGVRGFKTQHLLEPDTNLRFGTYYLKVVQENLLGSPLLASAAYNAGPRRARAWVASLPKDADGALFAELIPFAQTRGYVQKVLLNTAYYGAMLEGRPQSLTALLGKVPAIDPGGNNIP